MSEGYAAAAASGTAAKANDVRAATSGLRHSCELAAATSDSKAEIYEDVRSALLAAGVTETGAKGMASKVATVALWLRSGGQWPPKGSLNAAYNAARKARHFTRST